MMTVTVWLLIALGYSQSTMSRQTAVLERFASETECARVAAVINGKKDEHRPPHQCVQATIIVFPR